ncbi:MAG: hypothetical protein ACREQM_18050 [Candidatus Dormibacteraceae bacterium]
MPTRKNVSVDVLRQVLGDSRTDDLLGKLTPAKPTVPVDVQSLRLAGTLFTDPLTESSSWADTVAVIRRYFLDRGQSRRAFLAWLEQASASAVNGGPAAASPSRPRRKITDPQVLERRRAALAKAREARRQKLEAERRPARSRTSAKPKSN